MQIGIRYCAMCGYTAQAISLSDRLLSTYLRKISGLTLTPDSGGCFEVTADGDLLHSKLATDDFPDEQAVVDAVGARLPAKR